jgi:N-terminal domain of NWD NACHT-NTPase
METSKTGGESSQPETSRIVANVEPQSPKQVTSVARLASSALEQPADTISAEPPTPTASLGPTVASDTVASNPRSLPERHWDQAYDELKTKESTLVCEYEKILSPGLKEGDSSSVRSGLGENAIEQTNLATRRSQMGQLVQAGLKKTETEAKAKPRIGNAVQVVLSAKDSIDWAVQTVPQAALAWAGVCFALQILLNPVQETKASREGIIYVISRMERYWNLSSLLLKENSRWEILSRTAMSIREASRRPLQNAPLIPDEERLFVLPGPGPCYFARYSQA